jgi:hypothetical protein
MTDEESHVGLTIEMTDLRLAVPRVLDAVEATHGQTDELHGGLYWRLGLGEPNRLPHEPRPLVVGDLADDLETVNELARSEEDVDVWHDLDHLVGVLRRIAELDLPDLTRAPRA